MPAASRPISTQQPNIGTSLIGKVAVVVGLGFSLIVCVLFVVEYVAQVIGTLHYINTAHPHPTPVVAVFYGVVNDLALLAGISALVVNVPGLMLARGRWQRWARIGMLLGAALLLFQILVVFAVFIVTGFLAG